MCKACNTRFGLGIRVCPSCGRRAATHAAEATSSGTESNPLPSSEVDVDIDDELVLDDPAPHKPTHRSQPQPAPRARPPAPTHASPLSLDAAQIRSMLAEEPWLLETGLNLYSDGDGDTLGVDFPTPVGGIDILARDAKKHFVVVLVPSAADLGDSVSGMFQRMGWVRKHLADPGNEVRGVIVTDHVPEDLAYAVAGAGGAVGFKGFRFALTFHDLDV